MVLAILKKQNLEPKQVFHTAYRRNCHEGGNTYFGIQAFEYSTQIASHVL